jgi:small neutral amino acid transporter SnatA (MarC family)
MNTILIIIGLLVIISLIGKKIMKYFNIKFKSFKHSKV